MKSALPVLLLLLVSMVGQISCNSSSESTPRPNDPLVAQQAPAAAATVPFLYESEFCKVLPLGNWNRNWDILGPLLQSLALRMDGPDRFWIMPIEPSTWWVDPETGVPKPFIGELCLPRPSWQVDFQARTVRLCTADEFLKSDWTPRAEFEGDEPAVNEVQQYQVSSTAGGLNIVSTKTALRWPDNTRKVTIPNVSFVDNFPTQNLACVVEAPDDRPSFNLLFVDCESAKVVGKSISIPWSLASGMTFSSNWIFPVKPDGLVVVYLRTAIAIVDVKKIRDSLNSGKLLKPAQ